MNMQSKIRGLKFGNLSPLFITLINGVGWLFVYFLVLLPQASQNRVQTKLLDAQLMRIQSANQKLSDKYELLEKSGKIQLDETNRKLIELQISKLEDANSRLVEQLADLRARVQATNDLNSVIKGLRPNVLLGKLDFNFPYEDQVEIEHEIRNIGLNSVTLSSPKVRLSLVPINNNNSRDLIPYSDYTLTSTGFGIWQPGFVAKSSYSINLLNKNLIGATMYFEFKWQASTDPLAVSTARQILGKQITSSQLKSLSVFEYTLTGTFSFRKNNIPAAWPSVPSSSSLITDQD